EVQGDETVRVTGQNALRTAFRLDVEGEPVLGVLRLRHDRQVEPGERVDEAPLRALDLRPELAALGVRQVGDDVVQPARQAEREGVGRLDHPFARPVLDVVPTPLEAAFAPGWPVEPRTRRLERDDGEITRDEAELARARQAAGILEEDARPARAAEG